MNYLFIFDKGYISLFPLLDFEQYVWEQHKEAVVWSTDSDFPSNHVIGFVDSKDQAINDYYNLLINKTEELMSSTVDNTIQH
jgi:uncharacterized protein YciU (UPF0263 family)